MLVVLLQTEDIAPTEVTRIGNRSYNWKAARANALPFIAAVWRFRDEVLLAGSEDLIATKSMADILRALNGGKC